MEEVFQCIDNVCCVCVVGREIQGQGGTVYAGSAPTVLRPLPAGGVDLTLLPPDRHRHTSGKRFVKCNQGLVSLLERCPSPFKSVLRKVFAKTQ